MRTEAKVQRILGLLLILVLAASLLLMRSAQAQTQPGISTTQTADPAPAVVGKPHTFSVLVTNNDAVPQRLGVKDFLPPGMNLDSATPSQGTCGTSHHGDNGIECTLGEVPSGGSAKVEIVATPKVTGTMTNTAVGQGEFAPASPANSDEATIRVDPSAAGKEEPSAGEAHGAHH